MGCATSKNQQPVCRNCQTPCSPVHRRYSMHVHHPPQREGDSHHMVALTSSTLGSLKLDTSIQVRHINVEKAPTENGHDDYKKNGGGDESCNNEYDKRSKEEFAMGVTEAKTWSRMINEKIPKVVPKTPIRTPPGEPETINLWELMEGLEDTSPLRPPNHLRSFSFHVAPKSNPFQSDFDQPTPRVLENGEASPKPLWVEMADNDSNSNSNTTSIASEFDPEVISAFRKSLEELPPAYPFHLKPLVNESQQFMDGKDQVQPLDATDGKKENDVVTTRDKDKVVVFFTSLRGVRKTYEDCCHVRLILKGLGVKIDERDVSMHSGFKDELKELLVDGVSGSGLPSVFLGRKYIGGAEEIRQMHEEGQLEKVVVECCEMVDEGGGGGGVCDACGDIRFVPCETCSGSCKIYYEGDDYDEECEEDEYGFQRCPDCNENGLIRCPVCFD
ncbi:unnamed protein product [Ilex paraguariensis]|uniref:Glutaredoxin domain-containing protein n=1 Tax=Ilex paraguariensis TaxID=185542 RepID=A0ABC8UYE0_9AQUA